MKPEGMRRWPRLAMFGAVYLSVMNAYVATFTSVLGGFSFWRLADAILMAVFAFGFKKRNPALSAGCVAYFAVSGFQRWYTVRTTGNVILLILLELVFIQGVRATFMARASEGPASKVDASS